MATQTQTQTETQLSLVATSPTRHIKLTEIELPTKWKPPQKQPYREVQIRLSHMFTEQYKKVNYFKDILNDPDVKESLIKHDRQSSLDRNQIEK